MINLQSNSEQFSLIDSTIFELFSSTLYDGVWHSKKSEPEKFKISKNFYTLLGFENTSNLVWKDIVCFQDLNILQEQISCGLNTEEIRSNKEIRFIHKNGGIIWMKSHVFINVKKESKFIFVGFKDFTKEKTQEIDLKHQQKREYEILNGSGIGTWQYNFITGQVNYNESCAHIIGYTSEELHNMEGSFWDILTHPEDNEKTKRLIEEHIVSKSDSFQSEVRIRHKQGHWVWVVDIGKVLSYTSDNQPEWIGGIHYAITDRKNGELMVQQYKDLLEDVNEAAQIGIWEYNLKTNEIQWSKEIKKIFNLPMSFEPTPDNTINFIKEGESQQRLIAAVKNSIENGSNFDIEIEGITAHNYSLWIRAIGISEFNNGVCTRFYGFFQNINEKTLATKELALKEELFRKTFSHAAVGMAIVNLNGNMSKVNKNLCDYLGYSKKQLLQKNLKSFSHPEDKDISNIFIEELFQSKRESFKMDKRYIHKDGSIVWGHISVSAVRNESGSLTYYVVQLQDITERKNNELLLINYKDLLERSNYVAKIGSWEIDVHKHTFFWSKSLTRILNTRKNYEPSYKESIERFIVDTHRDNIQSAIKNALENGTNFDVQFLSNTDVNGLKWMRMIGISEFDKDHCTRLYGLIQDIDDIKKAEVEIINKEELWRTTFNHAHAGIALINRDGIAYNINQSLCDIFGYSIDEMQQMEIKDISTEEDLVNNNAVMAGILKGITENFSSEMRFLHKSGALIWANVSLSAVKNDFNEFTHIVAQLVDITDSKTNELLLKKYKEILERSNKVAKIGSWELNPESQILFWSENLGRLLGNTEYEPRPLSDSIIDYILEEDQEKLTNLLNEAILNGSNFDLELQLKTAKGLRWMRMIGISDFENGICISVHGLIQDIEEFKSVQFEILLREEEFRQTFWHAPIGMALLDLNGTMMKANPSMCEIFGYNEAEMIAVDRSFITHPDDLETSNQFMKEIVSGHRKSFQQEKRYFHKNNNLIWANLSISAVKNDKGQTTHFVCQIDDITVKKLLTESLKEHNNRLQNYAHIVSHNLRSHTGNLAMLLELSELNHKEGFKDELFDHIKSASNNMCETVDHLSEIVEIQNLIKNTLVPQNLKKRVKKALQNVRVTINQINGEVVTKVNKELMIFGISSYVDSIILNILTNAIKYRSPHRLLKIKISAEKVNGYTSLSISDNGLGMDLEKHGDKIFGMYKTFHDHKNARGIGLFIIKNQIEAMDGTIAVKSEPDIGTTFTINFKDENN